MIFFSKDDTTFTIEEFTVDDYGSAVFTDFNISTENTILMAQHQVKGNFYGMVHSHHHMNAIPSITDINQNNTGADQLMYFISLIVNNDGKWNARLTWKHSLSKTSLGTASHHTEIEFEEPVNIYFHTTLEIVREPSQSTDPKVLKLRELKKQAIEQSRAKATQAQINQQRNIFNQGLSLHDPNDLADAQLIRKYLVKYLLGNSAKDTSTVSQAIAKLTDVMWAMALETDALEVFLLELEFHGGETITLSLVEYLNDLNNPRATQLAERIVSVAALQTLDYE